MELRNYEHAYINEESQIPKHGRIESGEYEAHMIDPSMAANQLSSLQQLELQAAAAGASSQGTSKKTKRRRIRSRRQTKRRNMQMMELVPSAQTVEQMKNEIIDIISSNNSVQLKSSEL